MEKIDLDSRNIEELAALRDAATEKLAQKVMARQAELEAELEQLAQYGKLTKKALVAPPVARPKEGRAGCPQGRRSEGRRRGSGVTPVSRFRSSPAFLRSHLSNFAKRH